MAVGILGSAPAVLLDALAVDAEAEDGAHLPEGGADLQEIEVRVLREPPYMMSASEGGGGVTEKQM